MNIITVQKAREITEAQIQFVSLVDKAANKRGFLIAKAEDGKARFETFGRIVKVDNDTHYVTGIVYEPDTEDSQGDFMSADAIRKAAYWFAKNGNKIDVQHTFEVEDGVHVVENYIAPQDMEFDGQKVSKGARLLTVEINDAGIWKAIQDSEITGFSMGGYAKYSEEEVDLNKSNAQIEDEHKVIKALKSLLGLNEPATKGAVRDAYNDQNASREKDSHLWDAFCVLENVIRPENPETGMRAFVDDKEAIDEALSYFSSIVIEILTGESASTQQTGLSVEKTQKEMEMTNTELIELMKGEITKALDTAFEATSSAVNADETGGQANAESAGEGVEKGTRAAVQPAAKAKQPIEQPGITAEQIAAMVKQAVDEGVKAQIDPLLKAHGVPNNLNNENEPTEKAADAWNGFFGS